MVATSDQRTTQLFELAERKGFDVARARMPDHVRLIDSDGRLVVKNSGEAAFSFDEAWRYLDALPARRG